MKVLHLDHTGEYGGAELALFRLLSGQRLWNATIFSPVDGSRSVFDTLTCHHRVGPLQPPRASGRSVLSVANFGLKTARMALAIRRSSSFKSADLVHANTARAAVYGTLACIGSSKPLVVHVRDMMDEEGIGTLGARLMHRLILPRAAGVIASSRAALATVQPSLNPSVPTTVIPSPSNLRPGSPAADSGPPLCIGMVARIAEWKGQAILIRSFAQAFPDCDTVLRLAGGAFFGDEDYEAELRKLAQDLGVANRVRFEGHVEDVESFLKEIDIAVHCAIRPEPLGQNVLQYLAAGKPTIVSGEGGPLEWVRDGVNGLVFKPRSADSLATCLSRLASDLPLRERLASAAVSTQGLLSDQEVRVAHHAIFSDVISSR